MSSASLILTDGGLALCEPKAVGAQGGTKVLAASSLGSCLVFVSSAVVTVALAAIGRDMRLSPLDLQWVMNAELLPLAALTLVAGALGDRFGQKRIFLAGIALYGLGATAIGFAPSFAPLIVGRFLQGLGVLNYSQDSTWRWLSPRSRAFSPRSRCSLSSRGPTSTSSRETDPFGVRNQQAGKAGRKQ